MAEFKYLKREKKTGYWTYRRPIPDTLQEMAGRKEKSVSFGTDDLRAVRRAWPQVHVQVETWLEELRAKLQRSSPGTGAAVGAPSRVQPNPARRELPGKPLIDPRRCCAVFDQWAHDKINRLFIEISSAGSEYERFSAEHHHLSELAYALQCKPPREVEGLDAELRGVLASAHIEVPSDSPALELLRRPFAEAWAKVVKFRLDMNGSPRFVEPPPLSGNSHSAATQQVTGLAPNGEFFLLLSELVKKAVQHNKIREKKTIARLNLVVRHLDDIVGRPARLDDITKQVMIKLRDDAKYLPARLKSYERAMGFTKLVEATKGNPDDTRPKMKDEAILPWFNLISPVFDYAVDHDYMAANPCDRIKPKVQKTGKPKRDPSHSLSLDSAFSSVAVPDVPRKRPWSGEPTWRSARSRSGSPHAKRGLTGNPSEGYAAVTACRRD